MREADRARARRQSQSEETGVLPLMDSGDGPSGTEPRGTVRGDERTEPEGSRATADGERARWAAGRKGRIPRKIVQKPVPEVRTQG